MCEIALRSHFFQDIVAYSIPDIFIIYKSNEEIKQSLLLHTCL